MAKEIERKFLVDKNIWKNIPFKKKLNIVQAYIHKDEDKVIRIRIQDKEAFITIKGKANGIVRDEFEYTIPVKDAKQLIAKFSNQTIEKHRYIVMFKRKKWEIDVFGGLNKGLIIAEIELQSVDEEFEIPTWATEDVSADWRYHNSNLATNPYTKWE